MGDHLTDSEIEDRVCAAEAARDAEIDDRILCRVCHRLAVRRRLCEECYEAMKEDHETDQRKERKA